MTNYRTPDVYTEEISTLPPSVAEVSTAVPAFIGYTEKANLNGKEVSGEAVRISTFLEFKEIFGGYATTGFEVTLDPNETVQEITSTPSSCMLYYAVDFYFRNGGGACYIVSVGSYSDTYDKDSFLSGLEALSKEDEPTLIMLGEATKLPAEDYYEICQSALSQCAELKDRFCVFDVLEDEQNGILVDAFRTGIGTNNLKYGAAYTPYLQTSLSYLYEDADVSIPGLSGVQIFSHEVEGIRITYSDSDVNPPKFKINKTGPEPSVDFLIENGQLTIRNVGDGIARDVLLQAWDAFVDKGAFDIETVGIDQGLITSNTSPIDLTPETVNAVTLADIKNTRTALYANIVSELTKQRIVLPPSAGLAGVYATTDRQRGVWKAPANVSLNAVIAPTVKITSADQEQLNVDANAGKSVNAIRSFTGRGTLVWGARTLAGNDNEWRFVSVRRLFNMIEESTKKASQFAVFEPNDAATWLKVKAMIESFLYGIWQQGGLAGSTEDQAYFVNIGLGKTMTQQDILEGRMIVEIGIAAVRPAEFIILRFSHKLQEA
ncbi:MAG: phage tail sheath C-terminal domain-containing protein [Bacteroidota bacterium]